MYNSAEWTASPAKSRCARPTFRPTSCPTPCTSYKSAGSAHRPMNGGSFYVDSGSETIVDPGSAAVQNQLLAELRKCDNLVQLDLRYARIVAGASKMAMNMIWVARNQDESVSDTDLAAFKDLAWNEFVKKRYLPSVPASATVGESAASMLEIVREMNLQSRRFQIMGLHDQVEASEIQLILHLCQAGILNTDRYRPTANRFRRHDTLYEAFGLAVGAFVCASAPHTLGAATARYERDLQYEYKKNMTGLFVYALKQNPGSTAGALEEDYVARISRLIVVRPDDQLKVGEVVASDSKNTDSRSLLGAVATAQSWAEQARTEVTRLKEQVVATDRAMQATVESGLQQMRTFVFSETASGSIHTKISEAQRAAEAKIQQDIQIHANASRQELAAIEARLRDNIAQIAVSGPGGGADQMRQAM